jgi:hypothetical protein
MARPWKSQTDFHSRLEIPRQNARFPHFYKSMPFLFYDRESKAHEPSERLDKQRVDQAG